MWYMRSISMPHIRFSPVWPHSARGSGTFSTKSDIFWTASPESNPPPGRIFGAQGVFGPKFFFPVHYLGWMLDMRSISMPHIRFSSLWTHSTRGSGTFSAKSDFFGRPARSQNPPPRTNLVKNRLFDFSFKMVTIWLKRPKFCLRHTFRRVQFPHTGCPPGRL